VQVLCDAPNEREEAVPLTVIVNWDAELKQK
jgi:hypothetical protein